MPFLIQSIVPSSTHGDIIYATPPEGCNPINLFQSRYCDAVTQLLGYSLLIDFTVPMTAQPQPQAGGLVAVPSPPQPLQQIQGLPQPIPSALQQWISQTIQKEVQQQLSPLIQGAQGAQAAILQRRIYDLEQEVKRLGQEKQ
jgi:hypothetical protein